MLQSPTGSPDASYDNFARAATRITDDLSVAEQVFRRLVFNAITGNMDDHPKQHGFLYDRRQWSLAPAYDLTLSERKTGHSMSILGSVNPDRRLFLEFAREYDVRDGAGILEEIAVAAQEIPDSLLDQYGVPGKHRRAVEARIDQAVQRLSRRNAHPNP